MKRYDGARKRWSGLFVYAFHVLLVLTRSLNVLFRNLFFMNFISMTKYTLSIEFLLAQVRGNKLFSEKAVSFSRAYNKKK
jgi:hypothetical protein